MKNRIFTNIHNVFYVVAIFALVLGCSPKTAHYKKSAIDKMAQQVTDYSVSKRKVAAETKVSCFGSSINEETLLKDIKALENSQATPSRSLINGMDLSKIPPSQASFIESNRSFIHTTGIDFSNCTDLKCFFSRIYPNSDGMEGYLIYYFYLKMGYILSTESEIPGFNFPTSLSYTDFLFTRDELSSFYLLSKILNPTFEKVSTLKSIHRIPNRYRIPGYETACGLAGGSFNSGWIFLTDECVDKKSDSISQSNFYVTLAHEITHRVDYVILPSFTPFSQSQEWLDLSGWYAAENIDPQTGRIIGRKWSIKDDSQIALKNDQFVRDYAATSPIEDFAESVAYYRIHPESLKSVGPRKYALIAQKIYGSKEFLPSKLSDNYLEMMKVYALKQLSVVINKCVSDSESFPAHAIDLNDFPGYDLKLLACISGGLSYYLDESIASLKENEAEACSVFNNSETQFKEIALKDLTNFIKKDLDKNIEVAEQMKVFGQFLSNLNENLDPREVFVACQNDKMPLDCFNREIKTAFEGISAEYVSQIPSQIQSYQDVFMKENNFIETKVKMTTLFQQIFSGVEIKFKDEAQKRWKSCTTNVAVENEDELFLWPFDGGTQYIKKSLLNCLNRTALIDLESIIDKFGKRLGITIADDSMRKFIIDLYINSFNSFLQSKVLEALKIEEVQLQDLKNKLKEKTFNALTSDLSWLGEKPQFGELSRKNCIQKANEFILSETNSIQKDWNFFLFSKDSEKWSDNFCSDILSSTIVKDVLSKFKEQTINSSLKLLDDLVLKSSMSIGIRCRSSFSKSDKISIKARNACLTNFVKWNGIVNEALENWLLLLDSELRLDARAKGVRYLKNQTTILQDKAIGQMNR